MAYWIFVEKSETRFRDKVQRRLWTLPAASRGTRDIAPGDSAVFYISGHPGLFIAVTTIESRFGPPTEEQMELTQKWHPERKTQDVYYGDIGKVSELPARIRLADVSEILRFPKEFANIGIALQQTPIPIDVKDYELLAGTHAESTQKSGIDFLAVIRRYMADGTVFLGSDDRVPYCVESTDETGCVTRQLDAATSEQCSVNLLESKIASLLAAGGNMATSAFEAKSAVRNTYLQAPELALDPTHREVRYVGTGQDATELFCDMLKSLNVDRSGGQPRLYKPAMLACVVEGIAAGELEGNRVVFDWIAPRFIAKMRMLGEDVDERQAAMPFIHLQNELFWMLCYKDVANRVTDGGEGPAIIRRKVTHAVLKDTFWRALLLRENCKRCLDVLADRWWPERKGIVIPELLRQFLAQAQTEDMSVREFRGEYSGLSIRAGFGQGVRARVPWVALVGGDQKVQDGIYPVYLYYKAARKLLLCFCVSETNRPALRWPESVTSNYPEVKDTISNPPRYGDSFVYRQYDVEGATIVGVDDNALRQDIDDVIRIYKDVLGGQSGGGPKQHAWIFQSDPRYYDLRGALAAVEKSTWLVKQHGDQMAIGQTAYLWEAGPERGILAVARIASAPQLMESDPDDKPFIKDQTRFEGAKLRVRVEVEQVLPSPLTEATLLLNPVLSKLSIILQHQGTNFPVTEEQDAALQILLSSAQSPPSSPPGPAVLARVKESFATALRQSGVLFGDGHDELVGSFVASLATKPFVILTGLSGSGKTQIALKFGEWLGEGMYLAVPVRPDWTGAEALFGYEDALLPRGKEGASWHVPSPLEFMLKAAHDKRRPYLLILDEMNLAHVERYFADALSGIESRTRCLPNLVKKDGYWRIPADDASLRPFPRNLFVVGTVNVDETTYMFSPKVLDRANTFEFRVKTDELSIDSRPRACARGPEELAAEFLLIAMDDEWHRTNKPSGLGDFEDELRTLHTKLLNGGFEFGHRVFYEAVRFAAMYAATGDSEVLHSLDRQVMQKVLPRLHGSRRHLEATLIAVGEFCYGPGEVESKSFDPLKQESARARLPISFDKVRRMTKALRDNQFASFTE